MLPKENENENLHSPLDTNIHTSFISNSLKVETTQRTITEKTDGQNVSSCTRVGTFENTRKSHHTYAEWKKPDKEDVLHIATYTKHHKQTSP